MCISSKDDCTARAGQPSAEEGLEARERQTHPQQTQRPRGEEEAHPGAVGPTWGGLGHVPAALHLHSGCC